MFLQCVFTVCLFVTALKLYELKQICFRIAAEILNTPGYIFVCKCVCICVCVCGVTFSLFVNTVCGQRVSQVITVFHNAVSEVSGERGWTGGWLHKEPKEEEEEVEEESCFNHRKQLGNCVCHWKQSGTDRLPRLRQRIRTFLQQLERL